MWSNWTLLHNMSISGVTLKDFKWMLPLKYEIIPHMWKGITLEFVIFDLHQLWHNAFFQFLTWVRNCASSSQRWSLRGDTTLGYWHRTLICSKFCQSSILVTPFPKCISVKDNCDWARCSFYNFFFKEWNLSIFVLHFLTKTKAE